MKKRVLVRGPALSRSGYGEHVRFLLRSLRAHEQMYDLYLLNVQWGGTGNITAYGNYSSSIVSTASFGTYLGDGSQLTGISSGGGVADEAYTWFLA